MRVQATKVMTNAINKYLQEHGEKMRAEYRTASPEHYKTYVDYDLWNNEGDYLPEQARMRYIQIIYPEHFYAMPGYLTTRELLKIFKKSDKTYNGFMDAVLEAISI